MLTRRGFVRVLLSQLDTEFGFQRWIRATSQRDPNCRIGFVLELIECLHSSRCCLPSLKFFFRRRLVSGRLVQAERGCGLSVGQCGDRCPGAPESGNRSRVVRTRAQYRCTSKGFGLVHIEYQCIMGVAYLLSCLTNCQYMCALIRCVDSDMTSVCLISSHGHLRIISERIFSPVQVYVRVCRRAPRLSVNL